MKQINTLILLFLFSSTTILAQHAISFQAGYGSYAMTDFRDQDYSYITIYPTYIEIPLEKVTNFPSAPFFSVGWYLLDQGNYSFAVNYAYFTTGERFYFEDYSGYIVRDNIVKGHALQSEFMLTPKPGPSEYGLYLSHASMLNFRKSRQEVMVYESFSNESFSRQISVNLGLGAGLYYKLPISNFYVIARGGYYLDYFKGKPRDSVYVYSNRLSWRGFRVGLEFVLPLSQEMVY